MCGIAGYAGLDTGDAAQLRRMCRSLAHRGPDDEGYYQAAGVGLAMRRLAVIDLTTGHQPIGNETGTIQVVLNGEIYNYQELRTTLLSRGHHLATTSDTETIVHLYEDHGLDFVQHLRGMFAIALWDGERQRLVLVRDRIGEKPLFYTAGADGAVLFGSEIKAILQACGKPSVDPQAICDFMALGYVAGERTFYQGIRRLPPAHMLIVDRGRTPVLHRYWRRPPRQAPIPTFAEACVSLEQRLDESVRLCLKSDVEVGAFLSGGLDSSLIVGLMRAHAAQVQTFSVGYSGRAAGFNELHHARRVAEQLGTVHHELILGAHANLELLPRIIRHYDEPHGEPTSVLVYQLCEFTRLHLKVAMGGTGGDELFYGYPRHRGVRLLDYYRRLPRAFRRRVVERIVERWPESTTGSRFAKRARRFVLGSDLPAAEAYLGWVSLLNRDVREELLSDGVRQAAGDPDGDALLKAYLTSPGSMPLLDRVAALDVDGYLPEYQLAYMDRMSMAHGLEVRSPLSDFELAAYALSLPPEYRLKGTRSKHILKEVSRRWLPREIVERPKVGFDSPIGQWFKEELRPFLARFLSPSQVDRSGLLNGAAVQRLVAEHLGGVRDYSLQIWSIVALEAWFRMYIEGSGIDRHEPALADLRGASALVAPAEGAA